MTSPLHEDRLEAVASAVMETGAARVLDLGCGTGDLALRLAPLRQIARIVALDLDMPSLQALLQRLAHLPETARHKVHPVHATMTRGHANLRGYDCACLVETIEHLPPGDLPRLERAVFNDMRPETVLVTTPNAEFNPLLGVPARRFRHPGHHFEWDRRKFIAWGTGIARRNGYAVSFRDIGGYHPTLGGASQMAQFRRG